MHFVIPPFLFSALPLSLLLHLLLLHSSNAFNITNILGQHQSFSAFNNYLTQTQIASQINSRETITVLAVSDDAISPLSGKLPDVLRKIMSLHVILDYYDVKKLQNLPNKTQILPTLFQTSGQAVGQQGFLNATDSSSGVVIGSAVKGAPLSANLVGLVVTQPYNISVLQISSVIIPTGIDSSNTNGSSTLPPPASPATNSTSPSASAAPTPASSPKKSLPPTQPEKVPALSNAKAPAVAVTPTSDADALGSPPVPANALTADAPAADNHSASGRIAPKDSLGVALT